MQQGRGVRRIEGGMRVLLEIGQLRVEGGAMWKCKGGEGCYK